MIPFEIKDIVEHFKVMGQELPDLLSEVFNDENGLTAEKLNMGKEAADNIISEDKVKELMMIFDKLNSIDGHHLDDNKDAVIK